MSKDKLNLDLDFVQQKSEEKNEEKNEENVKDWWIAHSWMFTKNHQFEATENIANEDSMVMQFWWRISCKKGPFAHEVSPKDLQLTPQECLLNVERILKSVGRGREDS